MGNSLSLLISLALATLGGFTQTPSVPAPGHSRWDELTASDWPKALAASSHTCILPIGILEKHGPHMPIGSDLIMVREWSARATKKEYAVVFPDYFYGQINEARHQPGSSAILSRPGSKNAATTPSFSSNQTTTLPIAGNSMPCTVGPRRRSTCRRKRDLQDTAITKRILR